MNFTIKSTYGLRKLTGTNWSILIGSLSIFFCLTTFSVSAQCDPCNTITVENCKYEYDLNGESYIYPCDHDFTVSCKLKNINNCEVVYYVYFTIKSYATNPPLFGSDPSDLYDEFVKLGAPFDEDVVFEESFDRFARRMLTIVTVAPHGESVVSLPFKLQAMGKFAPAQALEMRLQVVPKNTAGVLCSGLSTDEAPNRFQPANQSFSFRSGLFYARGSKTITDLESEGYILNNHGIMLIPSNHSYPTLTINKNLTLVSEDICLSPGSSVSVNSGKTLYLQASNVYGCHNLANEIALESGSFLEAMDSRFENLRFAINAKPGSKISLERNMFVRNYIGLNLQMISAPFKVTVAKFKDNTFTMESGRNIKPAYSGMPEVILPNSSGYCGVRSNNYMDLNFFDPNKYEKINNGIIANNTSGNFLLQTIQNLTTQYPLSGYGIYMKSRGINFVNIGEEGKPNFLYNLPKAIYLEKMGGEVRFNTITATRGIEWAKSQGYQIRIRNNNISADLNGIFSFQNEPLNTVGVFSDISANVINLTTQFFGDIDDPNSGIKAYELPFASSFFGGGWEIKNNNITTNNGGAGIFYNGGNFGSVSGNIVNNLNLNLGDRPYIGMYLQNNNFCRIGGNTIGQQVFNSHIPIPTVGISSASGWANRFDCNCVDNTRLGILFADLANFTDAVQGNRMNTHSTTGLLVVNGAFIGKQHHTGNKWDLTQIPANGFGGMNDNSNLTAIEASKFYVDGNENPSFNPPVSPGSDWFEDQSTPSATFSCSSPCNFIYPEVPLAENCTPNDLDMLIANGGLTTDFYYNEMRWKANYRLYRKIIRCPDLQNYNSTLSTFKTYNQNLATGKLAWVAEQRSKIFDISVQQQNTQNTYFGLIQQQRSAIASQDSIRQEGQQVNEQAYDLLIQQRLTTQAQFEAFQLGLKNNRNLQINTLLLYNAGISTTNITPAANQKTVNSILLAMILNDTIFENDLTVLGTIANQCPLSGGDAVYEARSVVSYYNGIGFDDTQLCNTGQRPESRENNNQAIEKKDILVYPNPNSGDLWISGVEGELDIRIINQLGQTVVKKTVTNNHLSIKALPKGMYIVQIFSPEQQLLSAQKLEKEN